MPLLPKTAKAWIRGFASALLIGCIIVWMVLFVVGAGDTPTRVWRYAGPSIAGLLLPSLGLTLGFVCLVGGNLLDKRFRKFGFFAAVMSILLSLLFSPALAE